jgi:hypothetical protein
MLRMKKGKIKQNGLREISKENLKKGSHEMITPFYIG